MVILHIIDSGGLYGAEVMLLQLMCEQQSLGHTPVLASIGSKGLAEKSIEIEAKRLGHQVHPFRMANGPNFIGAISVLRFARTIGAQLLHSHGYKGNILFGLLPRKFRRLPMLSTVHGWTSCGRLTKMAVYEWLDKLSLKRVDRVVMVNPLMQQLPALRRLHNTAVIENGIGAAAEDVDGLNPEIIEFIQRRTTIVAVGRFSPEKGFASLLDAIAHLVESGHDVQLLLLGEGGLRQNLTEQIEALQLSERVLMPGHVAQVERYLSHCAVFAMPSLTEGLPIALLEAMRAGIPVVASNVGGIPDVLDAGRAGVLVPAADTQALVIALAGLLIDHERAEQLVKVARQRLAAKYSSRTMAEKYLDLYTQLIATRFAAIQDMAGGKP